MCPEQYDVYDGEKEVGYLRLRHGFFAAYLTCFGEEWIRVYESSNVMGDGCFDDEERDGFLEDGVNAIDKALNEHR